MTSISCIGCSFPTLFTIVPIVMVLGIFLMLVRIIIQLPNSETPPIISHSLETQEPKKLTKKEIFIQILIMIIVLAILTSIFFIILNQLSNTMSMDLAENITDLIA